MAARERGVIKSWSDREGRGVIRWDKGPDVEFSFAAIRQEPGVYLAMDQGRAVTFTVEEGPTGYRAQDVDS